MIDLPATPTSRESHRRLSRLVSFPLPLSLRLNCNCSMRQPSVTGAEAQAP
jgi:hypothetical protein